MGGGKVEGYKQVIFRSGDPILKHMRGPLLATGEMQSKRIRYHLESIRKIRRAFNPKCGWVSG